MSFVQPELPDGGRVLFYLQRGLLVVLELVARVQAACSSDTLPGSPCDMKEHTEYRAQVN